MVLKRVLFFVGIVILLGVLSVYYPYLSNEKDMIKNYKKEKCFVERVIDGDTLICDNETIRLLGIDTHEKGEGYYQEAKDFLKQVEGKEIRILRDWDNLGKYKRKLRYVFYDDELINVEILEQGLGIVFMTDNLKYEDKLRNAEKFAKTNCAGIWGEDC